MAIDMANAVKAPPVKKTTSRSSAPKMAPSTDAQSRLEARAEGLNGIGQVAQMLCAGVGYYADAATVGRYGPPLAMEVAKLAERYEIFANISDAVIKVGPFAGVIAIVLPFGMQIAANHKWIKPQAIAGMNIESPEVLEAEMKTSIIKMQLEAQKRQREMMEEQQKAQEELAKLEAMMAN